MLRAVAIAVGVALAIPSTAAAADKTRDAFDAAVADMSAERWQDAANKFVALADADPHHRLAADALFSAAKLYEERLDKPRRALALYRRLLSQYPDSREALAAERRAAELQRGMGKRGEGADALAAYNRVLQRFHLRSEAESIQRMRAVIQQYPHWRGLPRAMLWLGQLHERRGRLDRAQRRYLAAAAIANKLPNGAERAEYLFGAYRGAGEVAYKRGDLKTARRFYERMPIAGDPSKQEVVNQLLADLNKRARRYHLYFAALALLFVLLAAGVVSLRNAHGSWRAAGHALVHPPTEVLFMVPIALVLTLGAFTGHHGTAKAVTMISIGGVAITWLNGSGLSGPKRSRLRIWLHVSGSAIAVVCVCYIALHTTNLIDQMLQVLRLGPDVG